MSFRTLGRKSHKVWLLLCYHCYVISPNVEMTIVVFFLRSVFAAPSFVISTFWEKSHKAWLLFCYLCYEISQYFEMTSLWFGVVGSLLLDFSLRRNDKLRENIIAYYFLS